MVKIGFDNEKYLALQAEHIRQRMSQFGGKLYLEFGGKLFDDYHASRVLPGFQPDSKIRMLETIRDDVEIVIAINAGDIEKNKMRGDLGITYDEDVLRLIDIFRDMGLYVGSVVLTRYSGQDAANAFLHRLEKLGIRCKAFAPIQPFLSTHYNYRDHRKILVIDGKAAFTGGVNLADEYINRKERFGHWKDTAILLRGEAVQSFTLMFLQMWNLTEKEPRWDEALLPSPPVEAEGYVMPYCDCPLDDYKVGESVYMDILNRAKDYVHIMTPYLILDNEMETALKFAAQRGVDVKLILPGIPDKKAAYALAKSHYQYLTAAGVKLYEYTPGFVHAKIFVSDDVKAVVGTINLDYRSLYHHFECAAYLYGGPTVGDVERDFQRTLEQCRRVTPETIRHEKLGYKLGGSLMKLVAPLL